MITKFIEAGNGFNWGKFMVGQFDGDEWRRRSGLPDNPSTGMPLLRQVGWGPQHLWVLDLQTGEGAYFRPGGYAHADLDKHRIWVCPMFEPFLEWLYKQNLTDLTNLPDYVELPEAPASLAGYRRPGPPEAQHG